MGKQIKRDEIAEKDLYKDIRDSAEATINHINDLNESLGNTAKVLRKELEKPLEATLNSIEGVTKVSEEMNKTMLSSIKIDKAKNDALKSQIQAEAQLEKLEQESIKTQIQENKLKAQELKTSKAQNKENKKEIDTKKKSNALTDDEIKDKIKLNKANAERKKSLEDELILSSKTAGTLEKVMASSRKLRREREKLNLSNEEGRKRLKEINEELDDNNDIIKENSDQLKKQKLNVGNYTESIQEATGELGGMIGQIRDSIKGIKNQAKAFREQAKSADSAKKKMQLLGKATKALGIGALIALLSSVVSSMGDTRQGVMTMQGTMQKFTASISMFGNRVMDFFTKMGLKLEQVTLGIKEMMNPLTKDPAIQKRLKEIDAELTKLSKKDYSIKAVIQNVDKTLMDTFRYENALAKTSDEIERLRGQEELLSEQTGDMTLSFQDQMKAQREFNIVVEKRVKLEQELAQKNTDLKALKIRQSLIGIGRNYSLQQIKSLEFLKNEKQWMRINSDALAELSDAKTEEIAKENELSALKAKNAMEARNTQKDLFEKELDFAIDAFDVQKTINERIINNEKSTLEERKLLTEETRRLADSSFANQVKLVEDFTGKKLEFDKLLQMSDEEQIRSSLGKHELIETVLTRTLEILKERKIVVQDLADLEFDTNNKTIEKNKEISSSQQNIEQDNFDLKIELLEREFDKEVELGEESLEELKARLDKIKILKIKQLKDQAEFDRLQTNNEVIEQDEKAKKIEEINEKLKNDIIRLDNETLDAKTDLDKEEIDAEEEKSDKLLEVRKKRVDDQIAILQQLTNISDHLADKRIAKINEEIEASQQRFSNLQEMATNGNILAKESMAEEAKLIAEQTRRKEQAEKRKQRIQLASTVLQSYLTNSQDPDVKNPLQKTITDTVLLTEFIKSLPAFFDGTENTGNNGRGVDGKGGFLSILHPNERVIPKKNNDIIGDLSNDELSKLASNYQNGMMRDVADGLSLSNDLSGVSILADKLDSLERTISNKPEHNLEVEQIIDGAMTITRETRRGNTKIFNRYRV